MLHTHDGVTKTSICLLSSQFISFSHVHTGMAHYGILLMIILVTLAISTSHDGFVLGGPSDADVLLKFKDSIGNNAGLRNWRAGSNPCALNGTNWIGVLCAKDLKVRGLQLKNMGLTGSIDIDLLLHLTALRILSFLNNTLSGPIPRLNKLGALKSVFLSRNNFSGGIPDDTFQGMGSLKKVYLSHNQFTGSIPSSLTLLTKLLELRLEDNQFSGKIPDFQRNELTAANFSFNALEGRIPASLSKLDRSSFISNKELCGDPLEMPCGSRFSKKAGIGLALISVVIAIVIVLVIMGLVSALIRRRRLENSTLPQTEEFSSISNGQQRNKAREYNGDNLEQGSSSNDVGGGSSMKKNRKEAELGKLVFVREYKGRFELHDLLRASAEVLGSGSLGSSYKAVLESGDAMVVKRFREMNSVGKQEFEEHMRRLGGLNHPNLLPLLAFYYRKEEKLLVTNFVANGCLVQLLNGNPCSIDWVTRLQIIKGVARGLTYLHTALPTLNIPHGQLKASNIVLNESLEPLLTDYALDPVMNSTQILVAYMSPEYTQFSQISRKSDVWSFGIIVLEILTGKIICNEPRRQEEAVNLVSWVESVLKEDDRPTTASPRNVGLLLDNKMKCNNKQLEGEILKLLQIGLACCERDPEKRWELREAVAKIEEVRDRGSGDATSPSDSTEGDVYYSSRGGLSTEDISI